MQTVVWQKPQPLQCRRYRDVEYAVRAAVQDKRGFQHRSRSRIDGNAAFASLSIEPAKSPSDRELIKRWILSMTPNAASIACSVAARAAPALRISTKVPRSGRARQMLSGVSIRSQDPFNTFGDVHGGQGSAGNVADVTPDFERAGAGLADELR